MFFTKENNLQFMLYHPDRVRWFEVSSKEWALPLLKRYPDKVYWWKVSSKEWALPLLQSYPDKVYWWKVSNKEWALPLLRKHPRKMYWWRLPVEPWTLPLLMDNPENANWSYLSNQKWALPLLLKYPNNIHRSYCDTYEPSGIAANGIGSIDNAYNRGEWTLPLYIKYINDIDWDSFTTILMYQIDSEWIVNIALKCPEKLNWDTINTALQYSFWNVRTSQFLEPLIRSYPNKMQWNVLINHEWAFELLSNHLNKISRQDIIESSKLARYYYSNPYLRQIWKIPECESFIPEFDIYIQYNYKSMKESRSNINEQLCEYLYHPNMLRKWLRYNPEKHFFDYFDNM